MGLSLAERELQCKGPRTAARWRMGGRETVQCEHGQRSQRQGLEGHEEASGFCSKKARGHPWGLLDWWGDLFYRAGSKETVEVQGMQLHKGETQ